MPVTPSDLPLSGRRIGFLLEHPMTVGTDVQEHMAACRRLGAEVTACFLTGPPDQFPGHGTSAENLAGLNLRKDAISGSRLDAAWRLRRLLAQGSLDTLICDQYKAISTAALATFIPQAGAPAIVALLRGFYAVSSPSRRRFYRLLGRHIKGFITLSAAQQTRVRDLLTWVQPDRIHIIPIHLDPNRLAQTMLPPEEARQRWKRPEAPFLFGCISRLDPCKRVLDLVDASEILVNQGHAFRVIVIGGGKQEAELRERIARAGLDETVILTGPLESAHRFMPAFDGFVLPSLGESFGRVFLEAHAAEVPIIAANAAAAPEVAGPTAMLFQPENALDLADKMSALMSERLEQRRRRGQAGSDYAKRQFSQEKLDRAMHRMLAALNPQ